MYREAVINAIPSLVSIREQFKTRRIIATAKENSSEATRNSRQVDLGMIEAQLRLVRGRLSLVVLKVRKAADPGKLATEDLKTVYAGKQGR
jgi:hypothetical protein